MKKIIYFIHVINTFPEIKRHVKAVVNKMSLDPIPDKVKDLKKLKKIIVCKIIIFKKNANNAWKKGFAKIKRSICNILH